MVQEGIPHSLRPYIWMRLAGAMTKRANSEVSYRQIVRCDKQPSYNYSIEDNTECNLFYASKNTLDVICHFRASSNDHLMTSRQIEKDLLRTLPTNICYSAAKSTGVPRLRRILRGLAWLYPDIGYCQVRYITLLVVTLNVKCSTYVSM